MAIMLWGTCLQEIFIAYGQEREYNTIAHELTHAFYQMTLDKDRLRIWKSDIRKFVEQTKSIIEKLRGLVE